MYHVPLGIAITFLLLFFIIVLQIVRRRQSEAHRLTAKVRQKREENRYARQQGGLQQESAPPGLIRRHGVGAGGDWGRLTGDILRLVKTKNAQELRGLIGLGDGVGEMRDTARLLVIHGYSQGNGWTSNSGDILTSMSCRSQVFIPWTLQRFILMC
jgi:hypothetical protein